MHLESEKIWPRFPVFSLDHFYRADSWNRRDSLNNKKKPFPRQKGLGRVKTLIFQT